MAQNELLKAPVICENPECNSFGCVVNMISDIDDIDLFYAGYDGSNNADYCRHCGELGVAEDPVALKATQSKTSSPTSCAK